MNTRVLILGAGFGGLELSTMLSEAFGDDLEVTLIDKSDAFVFGFSKLDVMFGRTTPDAVRLPYRDIAKPGVRFLQETITAINPETRQVTTDAGVHEADALVVALGADYDFDATPGLADGANDFYTEAGAARLAEIVPSFSEGRVVVGVCGAPFKCPPAPSECALLLDDALTARGVERQLRDLVRHPAAAAGARRRPTRPRRSRRSSPSGASPSSRAAASARSIPRAASRRSTTAPRCRSSSSSACPSTVLPTW